MAMWTVVPNIIYNYKKKSMGSTLESRSNVLAKNWSQLGPNTYKNMITQELIDCHEIYVHNEEELMRTSNLFIKRASLTHPNVLKLIYFHHSPHTSLCTNIKFTSKIYIEQHQTTLANASYQPTREPIQCICCSIANGIKYLIQKYGWFEVNPKMVFMVVEGGLAKTGQRKKAKLWVSSDVKKSEPDTLSSEEDMCNQIVQTFSLISKTNLCNKINKVLLISYCKIDHLLDSLFQAHNKDPQQPRRRVASHYPTIPIQSINLSSQNPPFFSENLINQNEVQKTNKQIEAKKEKRSIQGEDKKIVQKIGFQNSESPFYKPKQTSSTKKINFSFTDNLATPKHNRTYKEQKKAKIDDHVQPFVIHKQSSSSNFKNQITNSKQNPIITQQQTSLISTFDSPHQPHLSEGYLLTQESSSIKLKAETDRIHLKTVGSQSNQKLTLESKQKSMTNVQFILEGPSNPLQSLEQKQEKELNIRAERNNEINYENTSRVSQKSFCSQNIQKSNAFGIVNEYRISVQPKRYQEEKDVLCLQEGQSQVHVEEVGERSEIDGKESKKSRSKVNIVSVLKDSDKDSQDEKSVYNKMNDSYRQYLKKFQEVTLSESNLHASSGPRSQKHYSSKIKLPISGNFKQHKMVQSIENSTPLNSGRGNSNFDSKQKTQTKLHEVQSLYNHSCSSEEEKNKVKILQKITNTQQILRDNRKKLEKLQLEKDLQIEKGLIKKQMDFLLTNNVMADESHRIKEKVRHKRATFAQLKAEANKILEDLDF